MKEDIIQGKSYAFALRIIKFSRLLKEQKEFEIAQQILRSGPSIGSNIEESIGGVSQKDFLLKISIAYKEAREALYWLKLIKTLSY